MEPKLPTPNIGPEQSPAYYGQSLERTPAVPVPEKTFERGVENLVERQGEAVRTAAPAVPVLPSPVLLVTNDDSSAPQSDAAAPLVANDDDLIEKEWVDKAKKIITETKDDPYRRELEVGRLQVDYLRKRYGRELGTPQ